MYVHNPPMLLHGTLISSLPQLLSKDFYHGNNGKLYPIVSDCYVDNGIDN